MFPQGGIWQQIRQKSLDTVPEGSLIPYQTPPKLKEWLENGAFTVSSATPRRIVLEASSLDIGAALFGDASYQVDHAIEHSLSMRNLLASGRWHSSAWSAVSVYYWAFFLVVALTRMLGKTGWFLAPSASNLLRGLAPAGTVSLGSGPFVLELSNATSYSQREVLLRRSGSSRVHDAVWHIWFEELRKLLSATTTTRSQDLESRLYLSQVRAANALGDSWPSDLRNLLNYVPGVGYGAVRGDTPAAVFGSISPDPSPTLEFVIDRLEANASVLSAGRPIEDQVRQATRVLIDMCFVLDAIVTALVTEITQRRNLDRRWVNARRRFIQSQTVSYTSKTWPCSDGALG